MLAVIGVPVRLMYSHAREIVYAPINGFPRLALHPGFHWFRAFPKPSPMFISLVCIVL
jgi:hypothetical protein